MLIILILLIHLLVVKFGAKQTPHLSLGLTEAPISESLRCHASLPDVHCSFTQCEQKWRAGRETCRICIFEYSEIQDFSMRT